MSFLEIMHTVKREGWEGGEASAEARHRGEKEEFLTVGTPAAMAVYKPSCKDAYQEASYRIDYPRSESCHRMTHRCLYQITAHGAYTARAEYNKNFQHNSREKGRGSEAATLS